MSSTCDFDGTHDHSDLGNDQQSILSDSISVASYNHQLLHSKKVEYKKVVMKLNKLKEENAVLREQLEKTKAQDIATLRAQLRGASVDLMRYRQLNSELKDTIQLLEAKLFTALGSLSEVTNKKSFNTVAPPAYEGPPSTSIDNDFQDAKDGSVDESISATVEHIRARDVNNLVDKSRSNVEKQRVVSNNALIKSLQSKCAHLQRLIKSYEKRMQAMQLELDSHQNRPHKLSSQLGSLSSQHKSVVIIEGNSWSATDDECDGVADASSVDADSASHSQLNDYKLSVTGDDDSIQSSGGKETESSSRVREDSMAERGREKDRDKRIIRELSSEIKRLVSLIPREVLQQSEEQQESIQSVDGPHPNPSDCVLDLLPIDEGDDSTDTLKTFHPSSTNPTRTESLNTHHRMLSFVLGCLVSCIGVALLHANECLIVNWPSLSKTR